LSLSSTSDQPNPRTPPPRDRVFPFAWPASAGRFVPHVISTLAQKVHDVVHDPKLPRYSDGVVEVIDHLRRIADQLGEGIELYPPLRLDSRMNLRRSS
jgi:hypothetical protein